MTVILFSDNPYKCDQNYVYGRPDICLETDFRHTPKELADILEGYFTGLGHRVKQNYPLSGTIIPERYENNDNLLSVKIEINRKLYLKWEHERVERRRNSRS